MQQDWLEGQVVSTPCFRGESTLPDVSSFRFLDGGTGAFVDFSHAVTQMGAHLAVPDLPGRGNQLTTWSM